MVPNQSSGSTIETEPTQPHPGPVSSIGAPSVGNLSLGSGASSGFISSAANNSASQKKATARKRLTGRSQESQGIEDEMRIAEQRARIKRLKAGQKKRAGGSKNKTIQLQHHLDRGKLRLNLAGEQREVGGTFLKKSAAYDVFAIYINDRSNNRLKLTGKQLRQRLDRYKARFARTKEWAENTGAGIEESDGANTLAAILEKRCPCYERMYAIFGAKHNVTPMAQYESTKGTGLYNSNSEQDSDMSDQAGDNETIARNMNNINSPEENHQADNNCLEGCMETNEGNECAMDVEHDVQSTRNGTHLESPDIELNDRDGEGVGSNDRDGEANELNDQDVEANPDQGLGEPDIRIESASERNQSPSTSPLRRGPLGSSMNANSADGSHNTNPPRPRFPNQPASEKSNNGPSKDSSQKSKSSVAGAFQDSTNKRFGFLESHLSWEKEQFRYMRAKEHRRIVAEEERDKQHLGWEREKYDRQEQQQQTKDYRSFQLEVVKLHQHSNEVQNRMALEKEHADLQQMKFDQEVKEKQERVDLAKQMMNDGKSAAEIKSLIRVIYGTH
ncbi:hypothetical protein PGT21_012883 [Puccinia graminis f. sp. tritici]|uniref:No apical meristem-associated C-terminal domain-containing protein n=1 Tax=Puccinia graminis f. sp. tritici TaxID=56615 RepID=A0A5B0QSX9_PUCGR|nr:hypothetical protein PGT21_012883 [Puccinia graminis f. sp. tritici]